MFQSMYRSTPCRRGTVILLFLSMSFSLYEHCTYVPIEICMQFFKVKENYFKSIKASVNNKMFLVLNHSNWN